MDTSELILRAEQALAGGRRRAARKLLDRARRALLKKRDSEGLRSLLDLAGQLDNRGDLTYMIEQNLKLLGRAAARDASAAARDRPDRPPAHTRWLGWIGIAVGLLALYYAIPFGVAIISLGEICPYSPAGTDFCSSSPSSTGMLTLPFQTTSVTPRSEKPCTQPGIRYAGKTADGASVCFTLTRTGKAWVEIDYVFVAASGCPGQTTGRVHLEEGTSPLSSSGRIEVPKYFAATIRGATASGVLEDSRICQDKKFAWSARRQPGSATTG